MPDKNSSDLKNTGYEIFIGMLSILSIFNLLLVYAFVKDEALQQILRSMNLLLTGIFLMDFIYRLSTAQSRSGYFFRQFGWADILSCLPIAQVKVFRVFRLLHVYRLLREYGIKYIVHSIVKDRAGSALLTLLMAGILVMEFGSLAILRIEEYASGSTSRQPHAVVHDCDYLDGRLRRPLSESRILGGSLVRSSSLSGLGSSERSPATWRTLLEPRDGNGGR